MKHYVYRLDDPITGEFYIGSRSCKVNIENDKYMGSYKSWKPQDKTRLVKTILKSNFRKRETCTKYEAKLIKENIDNPLNRNYALPNNKFHNLGRKLSKEHIEKLRISHIGHTRSKETREKISKSQYKEVYQLDMKLNIINKFKSIQEAAEKTGNCSQSISLCATKKMVSHPYLKYHWCFPNDYKNFEKWKIEQSTTRGSTPKSIIIENNGIVINTFSSIKEASLYYNISYSGIHHNLSGRSKKHKLGIWKYK